MQLPNNNFAQQNLSALVDFSNHLNSNLNLEFTLNNLLLTCFGKLHTTKGVIALYDKKKLIVKLSKGLPSKGANKSDVIEPNKIENFKIQNKLAIQEQIISSGKEIGHLFLGNKLTGQEYSDEDLKFLNTILQIGSTAIGNSINFEKLETVNKTLDSKVNQLNSLFDLGKEFGSILEIDRVAKLLVFSVTAQMLVSKFAVLIIDENEIEFLDNRFNQEKVQNLISESKLTTLSKPFCIADEKNDFSKITSLGVELIVPMIIKGETKGLILLGKRMTNQKYSKSDIEFISSVGSLAIISIENSRLFKEAIEKQKMEKDLELARNIQQNLLPTKIPLFDNFEIAANNNTARMVGGDFYDVTTLENGNTIIAIADVSGKGIQASLLMANLQAFLKSIYKLNYPLKEASNILNDLVSENTTDGSFITFFWGVLNKDTNEFTYVNMGHNPPLLIRDKEIIKLTKGGMIIGVMETIVPYESERIQLEKDDTLILFTDGVTEAMDTNDEEYSDERLEEFCLQNSSFNSQEILENILNDVANYSKDAEQSDDITCMVIKIK
ncbi:MAG: SpoIIE family protein phosphatase [Ignavibacteriae bacterium]|nr:SpoIIE family protein phosphatase [Ignavibacteriota bacterium]